MQNPVLRREPEGRPEQQQHSRRRNTRRPCPPTCPPKPNGRRWKPWQRQVSQFYLASPAAQKVFRPPQAPPRPRRARVSGADEGPCCRRRCAAAAPPPAPESPARQAQAPQGPHRQGRRGNSVVFLRDSDIRHPFSFYVASWDEPRTCKQVATKRSGQHHPVQIRPWQLLVLQNNFFSKSASNSDLGANRSDAAYFRRLWSSWRASGLS